MGAAHQPCKAGRRSACHSHPQEAQCSVGSSAVAFSWPLTKVVGTAALTRVQASPAFRTGPLTISLHIQDTSVPSYWTRKWRSKWLSCPRSQAWSWYRFTLTSVTQSWTTAPLLWTLFLGPSARPLPNSSAALHFLFWVCPSMGSTFLTWPLTNSAIILLEAWVLEPCAVGVEGFSVCELPGSGLQG
jgi:hypothetical protein